MSILIECILDFVCCSHPFLVAGHLLQGYYFFNWGSLHAMLNSHHKAWSQKKKQHKKIKAHRKSVYKEPTVKRCLLILDLQPFRSQDRRISESSGAREANVDIDILVTSGNGDNECTYLENKEVEPVEPVHMNIYLSNTYRKHLS